MVKQSREPFLLPFLCRLSHTPQSLGHACLALCRERVGWRSVLLGPLSSLPNLRRRFLGFVRLAHRYYRAVRLLGIVHAGRLASAFSHRTVPLIAASRCRGLPVLVHAVSQRARGLRLRRAGQLLALALLAVWPSP